MYVEDNPFSSFSTKKKGFPPDIPEDSYGGEEPPAAVKDMLPGGPMAPIYWGYVKKWWPYRDDPNVILLHYSDVRKDLKGHVKKIAKFLEVDLSGSELDTVTQRCGIDHMKKVNKFNYLMPLNQDKGKWDAEKDHVIASGALVRKGGVKTGASIFSDTVVAKWEKAEEDEFGGDPDLLHWAREGGKWPPVEQK